MFKGISKPVQVWSPEAYSKLSVSVLRVGLQSILQGISKPVQMCARLLAQSIARLTQEP